MSYRKRAYALLAAALIAVIVFPAVACAASIQVNTGVAGAKLGMGVKTAAHKLGKVQTKYKDTTYGKNETIWVWTFGKTRKGQRPLEMYSNGRGKVTAFIVYGSSYATSKGIHTGVSLAALKRAYGSSLVKGSDSNYTLATKTGKTAFHIKRSKIEYIMLWR